MQKRLVLSLDLGTTGNRAIAFSDSGEVVAFSYYPFKQHFPKPGWVEHDPIEIWDTLSKAISDVLKEVDGDTIVSVGITNQRETTIVWDRQTGEPIHNAIVWQCRRTTERCKALTSEKEAIKEKTGLFLDPYFSASKIEWILNHANKQDKSRYCFGTVDTWIIWKLTQGRVHATDSSNASRTMLFNINEHTWDDELCRLFSVPTDILPEVKRSSDDYGHVDPTLFGYSWPIQGVIGDQQAALFTQCGQREDIVKNTYGTGLFVCKNTGTTPIYSERLVTSIGWSIGNNVNYCLEGSIFIGGSAIQWLRDGLGVISDARETEALALSLNDNEGVYFVPALVGLGAPHWNPDARGLITGLTRGTTQAHLARAALESMAYQTKDVLDVMGDNLAALRVDGGAVKNNFLLQFQADILGIPVECPKVTETTAFGAAGMAGLQAGIWTLETFPTLNPIEKVIHPVMGKEDRNRYIEGWRSAIANI